MKFRTHCWAECCRASSADSEGNWGRRPSVFSKDVLPNAVLSIDVSVPQIQEQRVEVQRGNPQERLQLRNSGNRQRLQNVWQKDRSNADCQKIVEVHLAQSDQWQSAVNTPVNWPVRARTSRQRPVAQDKNSQKVPKTVEVSKQQYTDMNVDVPAEMQRQITVTHTHGAVDGDSTTGTCGRRHCRTAMTPVESATTVANDSEGYRSQYSDKAIDASGVSRTPWCKEHRERCTVERQVQMIQKMQLDPQ